MMRDAEWAALGQSFADIGRFLAPLRWFAAERFGETFKLPAFDVAKAGAQCFKTLSQLTQLAPIHDIADDSILARATTTHPCHEDKPG